MLTNPYYRQQQEHHNEYELDYCLDYFNKRLRVDDYAGNTEKIAQRMIEITRGNAFTKVFIKARQQDWPYFLSQGFMLEGVFEKYYSGSDAYSMAKYFDLVRHTSDYWLEEDHILNEVLAIPAKKERLDLPSHVTLRAATFADASQLAALYRSVFLTYPTPMNDPAYIRKIIAEDTIFYVVEQAGELVSAASAAINGKYQNAEMGDCATLPRMRKHGLMQLLMQALEHDLQQRHIFCVYALARALSFGMNAVFAQLGYRYNGRMTKNCNIYDKFEDMNLWVKQLSRVTAEEGSE
ncbi:putative beta-lysine N-acetyltransferase [Paenibacillus sp. 481]|uniref:putative beta-lysine N-acetyltransferase n=1 Tax=Paenibacillus sp. 481 TaxID=2835869 RepID=UPI001E44DEEC|nr:putative beta-lysine N-acetyltransferase [Paenibacillus sp. 481]UHA73656.1 putative beta-lysine N-acetyltransferase [Paenibacillus sp. 481]